MSQAAPRLGCRPRERRAAIVAAALQVFGSGSYAGSTTAEIARAAGVSEPIIYRHFPSKRELWFACLDEAWRELRAAIELQGGVGRPRGRARRRRHRRSARRGRTHCCRISGCRA